MNTLRLPVVSGLLLLSVLSLPVSALAQPREEALLPRSRHPWASFGPGSWKLVKVTTETFDEAGKSLGISVTETRSMLLAADDASFELQAEVTLEVAGKRFASDPKVSRQGLLGETAGQKVVIRGLGEATLKIGERTLTAQGAEIDISDNDSRKLTRLRFAVGSTPYVLARESTLYDAAGKAQQETEVQTIDLETPRTVLGRRRSTWRTRTTQTHATGSVVTDEIHCPDVPGGVVAHTLEERDEQGQVRRRSRLELVNFGVATADTRLRRRRLHRKSWRKNSAPPADARRH